MGHPPFALEDVKSSQRLMAFSTLPAPHISCQRKNNLPFLVFAGESFDSSSIASCLRGRVAMNNDGFSPYLTVSS